MTQTVILSHRAARQRCHALVDAAPQGAVVTIKAASRSTEQNSKLWAMLSEVSRAKPEGRNYPPEVWKDLFMSLAGFQARWEPALDGNGVVNTGYRSSRLTVAQMSELIEQIHAWGAERGVVFQED